MIRGGPRILTMKGEMEAHALLRSPVHFHPLELECIICDDTLAEEEEASGDSDDDAEWDQDFTVQGNSNEYTVNEDVARLGLAFSKLPPDPLVIKRVSQGSWAESQGIEVGDMVVSVNGMDVQQLCAGNFIELLMKRPLVIGIDSLAVKEHVLFSNRRTLFDTDFLPLLAGADFLPFLPKSILSDVQGCFGDRKVGRRRRYARDVE